MKHLFFSIFVLIFSLSYAQKDTRSFEQINDSILREARTIYTYDKAFTMSMQAIDAHRKLRKSAGEVLVMPKNDTVYALVFSKDKPEMLVGEMKFGTDIRDSAAMAVTNRAATQEELNYYDLKHRIMQNVQSKYDLVYGDKETYLNPIFFPFKEKIRGQEVQLYKLYLTTESNASNTLPFGQDYMFIATPEGKVIYNLQFNPYMPLPISNEMIETTLASIEYPEREPYITPTDIYLFNKYGAAKGLNILQVNSTAFGIIFQYDWDREELNVMMPEPEDEDDALVEE